jgi:hypothetical protein
MAYNDGGVPHGGLKVQLYPAMSAADATGSTQWGGSTAKGVYILESLSIDRPMYTASRYNETRVPNGQIAIEDFVAGSAVIQLATAATAPASNGDAFTGTLEAAIGAESFVLSGVSRVFAQGEIRKQTAQLRKLVAATSLPPAYP